MGITTSDDYIRQGYKLNGEVTSLKEAVDRSPPGTVPGPWWQQWMGFYGSWTQFFSQNIQKPPILPIQDDSDLKQWGTDLDRWKKEFSERDRTNQLSKAFKESTSVPTSGKPGELLPAGLGTLAKGALVVTGLFGLGYVLSGARVFRNL